MNTVDAAVKPVEVGKAPLTSGDIGVSWPRLLRHSPLPQKVSTPLPATVGEIGRMEIDNQLAEFFTQFAQAQVFRLKIEVEQGAFAPVFRRKQSPFPKQPLVKGVPASCKADSSTNRKTSSKISGPWVSNPRTKQPFTLIPCDWMVRMASR